MTRRNNDSSTFTNAERARLRSYRRAIRAGFYSDWDGSASATDSETLAWLHAREFPFTPAELARLEHCRALVIGGYYSETPRETPASG